MVNKTICPINVFFWGFNYIELRVKLMSGWSHGLVVYGAHLSNVSLNVACNNCQSSTIISCHPASFRLSIFVNVLN